MALQVLNFKFKPIKAKRMTTSIKRISSIVTGLVSVTDGKYTCNVYSDDNTSSSGDMVLPFTDKSFELKGRETVFDRIYQDNEKKHRYIRSKLHSMNFPGDKHLLVPFAPNWIVKGYVVEIDGKKYFDFSDLVGLNGYGI